MVDKIWHRFIESKIAVPVDAQGEPDYAAAEQIMLDTPETEALPHLVEYFLKVIEQDNTKKQIAIAGDADVFKVSKWAKQEALVEAYVLGTLDAMQLNLFEALAGRTLQTENDPQMLVWWYKANVYRLVQFLLERYENVLEELLKAADTLVAAEVIFNNGESVKNETLGLLAALETVNFTTMDEITQAIATAKEQAINAFETVIMAG